jgi:transposase-like protein
MSSNRKKSPWAYDEGGLQCPSCHSIRVTRVVNAWAMARGIQMFKCSVCGKTFYEKDVDDYRPTFER